MASRTIKSMATVPLAGFANPRYLGGANQNDATGFEINMAKAIAVFVPTGPTVGITIEQTFDVSGLTDWFPVPAQTVSSGASSTTISTTNNAYLVPAIGVRMRLRVTTLTVADLLADIALIDDVLSNLASPLSSGSNGVGYLVSSGSSSAGIVPVTSGAAAASLIVNASACNLYGFNVKAIDGATAQKLLLINSATVPADGAVVPLKAYDVPAAGTLSMSFNPPIRFGTGCVMVLSSAVTPYTKTLSLAANFALLSAEKA